ncbi:hypothetical protein ABT083_23560 [Streptomyces goshikiensis]|uniref:hypothetical protein n=1 Tax=Streptomyces goshikiensis TaxID=1942 RepID=UPI003330576B
MLVMPAAQQQARESGGAVGQLVGVASCGEDGGVIERDHAPNAGTGLLGANFSRRSRLEPTDDRAGAGRWIAIDESGYHGDQLHGGDRYMILGSVAIDDADAAAIVDTLHVEGGDPEVRDRAEVPEDVRRLGCGPAPSPPGRPAGTRWSAP